MAENNNSAVLETEELTSYTTETNSGAGTGTSTIAPGYGTGRRTEAVARVRLVPGTGKWTINGRTLEEYFPSKLLQREVNSPIVLLKLEGKFDCIVLDPPAFCKSADEVKDAYRGYKDLNLLAMKLVRPGGYLVTCSCSHYMTFPLFEKMLVEAARSSGRRVQSVETKTQAPDHPSLLCAEETQYLKFFVLHVI